MTPEREVAFYARLGERIRAARTAQGMTQASIGAALGVSAVAVSDWESAANRPSLFTLRRLEAVLREEIV